LTEQSVLPFLKWAGGKRWLVGEHCRFFPSDFHSYIEPFLGSGAVFFHLRPKYAVLADTNPELILTYQAIKDDWKKVLRLLQQHARRHSPTYYYEVRNSRPRSPSAVAARLIYLNRTCWNGVFRVNRFGEFNVPIGTKQNVVLESDDFAAVANRLKRAKLVAADFADTISKAGSRDFVYADPPYTVNHDKNGFVKYNGKLFTWEDQIRLHESLVAAKNRGATIVLSNAHHHSIRKLYGRHFRLITLTRKSIVAGDRSARGICREYLVTG
jgi:DNA adenine methylase